MARANAGERAQERLYRPRRDGDWDYFPRGFAKPGYRVTDAIKAKLKDASQTVSRQAALITAAALALAKFGGPEIARSYPAIAPYARSGIISCGVCLLLLMILLIPLFRWNNTMRKNLLKDAPPAGRSFTPEEAKAVTQELFQSKRSAKIILIAMVIGFPAWMIYAAGKRIEAPTAVGIIESIILLLGAALILLLPVALLVRRLRAPRI